MKKNTYIGYNNTEKDHNLLEGWGGGARCNSSLNTIQLHKYKTLQTYLVFCNKNYD